MHVRFLKRESEARLTLLSRFPSYGVREDNATNKVFDSSEDRRNFMMRSVVKGNKLGEMQGHERGNRRAHVTGSPYPPSFFHGLSTAQTRRTTRKLIARSRASILHGGLDNYKQQELWHTQARPRYDRYRGGATTNTPKARIRSGWRAPVSSNDDAHERGYEPHRSPRTKHHEHDAHTSDERTARQVGASIPNHRHEDRIRGRTEGTAEQGDGLGKQRPRQTCL